MNAVRNEHALSDAPFLSTTVAPKHPVELFRHLTHTQDRQHRFSATTKEAVVDADFWHSPFTREECACARPFDATQWRHQLMYTACPVNSCSAICLALGSGGRLGTLGTMSSSPSIASSRIGSCAPPGSSGSGFLRSYGFDPARDECLSPRTAASHQSCFLSVSCRCCTHPSLCTQLYSSSIVESLISFWIHASIFFATFEPLWNM